jgi:hypothetical protein
MKKRGIITLIVGAAILLIGIVLPLVFSGVSKGSSGEALTILDPQR